MSGSRRALEWRSVRPDGTATRIWACGECHRPHASSWKGAHQECIPKLEPKPLILRWPIRMPGFSTRRCRQIGERCWYAGWLMGSEYALWELGHSEKHNYGRSSISDQDMEELRVFSEHAGGWMGPDRRTSTRHSCHRRRADLLEWRVVHRRLGRICGGGFRGERINAAFPFSCPRQRAFKVSGINRSRATIWLWRTSVSTPASRIS
jgi:hypothetical protein